MKSISRRDFLKLGAATLGGLAFSPYLPEIAPYENVDLVRVAIPSVSVFKEPSDKSMIVGQWFRDDVIHVYKTVTATEPTYNPVWYRVWGGYMHRARLQKVKIRYNQPVSTVPKNGMLVEVTVPYSQAYFYNKWDGWKTTYRLYYNSVHWVKAVEEGPDKRPWYRILDELDETTYLAPAAHLRPIPPEELAPISPEIAWQKKRIEVTLSTQKLVAYENDVPVFDTNISSGLAYLSSGDIPTNTPVGDFNIMVKMPSKHMGEADLAASLDDYVIPGVPWTSFFTERGHAFHGTYWHDNFGVPMSHGCINMRPEEAKWIYRWSLPLSTFDDINPLTLDRKGYGTKVRILP
jgi:lipoprotein-anchoring transpeptidase ErfK/SrfK